MFIATLRYVLCANGTRPAGWRTVSARHWASTDVIIRITCCTTRTYLRAMHVCVCLWRPLHLRRFFGNVQRLCRTTAVTDAMKMRSYPMPETDRCRVRDGDKSDKIVGRQTIFGVATALFPLSWTGPRDFYLLERSVPVAVAVIVNA